MGHSFKTIILLELFVFFSSTLCIAQSSQQQKLEKYFNAYNDSVDGNNYKAALKILNRIISIDSSRSKYYYLKAKLENDFSVMQIDSSLINIKKAIALNDKIVDYYFFRVNIEKNDDEKERDYLKIIQLDSGYVFRSYEWLYNRYSNNSEAQKAFIVKKTAIRQMKTLIKRDSTNDKFWYWLAMACALSPSTNQLKPDSSLMYVRKAIALNDTMVDYYFLKVNEESDQDEKEKDYLKIIRLDSGYVFRSYDWLYTKYSNNNEPQKASRVRKTAIRQMKILTQKDSTNDKFWYWLALAYDLSPSVNQFKSVHENVMNCFNRAISINNKDAEYYYQRGSEYFNYRKDYKACISDMKEAIALDNQSIYWQFIASSYEELGDNNKAMEAYDNGLKADPGDLVIIQQKGLLEKKIKRQQLQKK